MSILRVIFKKKVSRSIGGDIVLVVFLSLIGILMILPFVYTISTSLKPANELWLFPPRFFVIKGGRPVREAAIRGWAGSTS